MEADGKSRSDESRDITSKNEKGRECFGRGGRGGKGKSTKWLTIFAEEMKFAEFFSGKGKAWKEEEI